MLSLQINPWRSFLPLSHHSRAPRHCSKVSFSNLWGSGIQSTPLFPILLSPLHRVAHLPVMAPDKNLALSTPYRVFAFLVGIYGKTGPRLISVHRQTLNAILPIINRGMFPEDAVIQTTHTVIQNRRYCVYFDRARHLDNCNTASYLFIRELYPGRPINICPEDDLPDIIQGLKEYAL